MYGVGGGVGGGGSVVWRGWGWVVWGVRQFCFLGGGRWCCLMPNRLGLSHFGHVMPKIGGTQIRR